MSVPRSTRPRSKELHHRRPHEQLGHRADPEERRRRVDHDAVLQSGIAVALGEETLSTADQRDRRADGVQVSQLRVEQPVEEGFGLGGIRRTHDRSCGGGLGGPRHRSRIDSLRWCRLGRLRKGGQRAGHRERQPERYDWREATHVESNRPFETTSVGRGRDQRARASTPASGNHGWATLAGRLRREEYLQDLGFRAPSTI